MGTLVALHALLNCYTLKLKDKYNHKFIKVMPMVATTQPQVLGYSIFSSSLSNLPAVSKIMVNTINQYSCVIAEEDAEFKNALLQSDVLLPDGVGIVLASKFLSGRSIAKIAGADLHQFVLNKLQAEKGSCFYLGSSQQTLDKIAARMKAEYPGIEFGTYSPPFKQKFDEEDNSKMIAAVNSFKPDVLFVGMTAPKQEKWVNANKDKLQTKTICSIGAVFDFFAGTVHRPNRVFINLGLEWLGRLLNEPQRMWKRYIYYGFIFLLVICKEKLRLLHLYSGYQSNSAMRYKKPLISRSH